jgi:NAD(P)-dependent dehydrogenase (short-subunit alcohol dehydrogenase family)
MKDKVVIITGASSGIGLVTAKVFASAVQRWFGRPQWAASAKY